jgi:hypothetical protein
MNDGEQNEIGLNSSRLNKLRLPLGILVLLNLMLSIGHYTDNVMHFDQYAEPVWLHAHSVDAFWFILAAWLIPIFFRKNVAYASGVFLVLTCLSLMHYNYASLAEISLKIHFYIWAEFCGALLFLPYILAEMRTRDRISWPVAGLAVVTVVPLLAMMKNAILYVEYLVALEIGLVITLLLVMFYRSSRVTSSFI